MKRRLASSVALAAAALMFSGSSQAAEWKLAHWLPPAHHFGNSLTKEWGPSIEHESFGEIKFKYFPASQLGKASDHFDMTKDGIADVTFINPGFNVGRWPVASAGEFFMLFSNPPAAAAALTTWYRKHAAKKEMPEIKYCFSTTMEPLSFFSVKKKIVLPSDLKGMRVRPSNSTQAKFLKKQGATSVFFPLPKVREPLERGVVDVVNAVPFSLKAFGGNKLIKYAMKVPLTPLSWMVVINKNSYDKLSAAGQSVIDNHCNTYWAARVAANGTRLERSGWNAYEGKGKEVYGFNASQTKAWLDASAFLIDSWKSDVAKKGFDGNALYADLKKELKRRGASSK